MKHSLATFSIRPLAALVVLPMLLSAQAAWAAAPAQIPLTSRVAEPPTPNVMLTIDDSGSMLADFMPEGVFKVAYGIDKFRNIDLATGWVGAYPGDIRKLEGKTPIGNYLDGVVTGLKGGETVYQKQYRSSDINGIFYNPDVLYLPWYKPDGSGRMANSSPTKASWDPIHGTSSKVNLTVNSIYDTKTKLGGIYTNWHTAHNTKSYGTRDFYPGLYYRLKTNADPNALASYDRYDINVDGEHSALAKHANRTDCAGARCTQAEERQNFANWFTYYRMRESLTKAAVSEAFVAYKDKLRVGWGRINNETQSDLDGVKFSIIETAANGGPMRQFDASRMKTVLTGVQNIKSWPNTPLRIALDEVGRYFDVNQRGATGSPWLSEPNKPKSEKLSCRRSVNLMMTDGYYNDDGQSGRKLFQGAGDVDNSNGPEYTGTQNPLDYSPTRYIAERPFIDSPKALSNTLADVASKYYVKDLDPAIDNKVWKSSDDIAYWQHLTQFMVGLGVKGTLDASSPTKKAETLAQIKAGTLNWPDPTAGNPEKIDDMWHAAVNTGGDFYSAANVTELTAALKDAFGRAAGTEAKEAGVATVSPSIVANNVKYVPKYRSVAWWGDLEAYELDEDGLQGSLKWSASAALPAHASRKLFTWDGSKAEAFTGTMSAANVALVGSTGLVNYIRGDNTDVGEGKSFRDRDGKLLGDFVNSPPALIQGNLDLGYAVFDASYAEFVARKKARKDAVIVVGGNDGMAHIFRGLDGREVFGYLPREGLSNLRYVAAKDYGTNANFHKFFVDGPMIETDAKIKGQWANLALGAMGAGGKTFFALQIPTDLGDEITDADFSAASVLWERSGSGTGADADIGYMFADFAVGKIKGSNDYMAFVGNGVYSTNGNAVLLVVNLATGQIEKLTADSGGGTGLMGVTVIKDLETQEVVGAYAGDLKGNVWRFDFQGAAPASWKVGFSGQALFRATDPSGARQPITIPPVFVDHPKKGRVVLFGTGRLIDEADAADAQTQTYYGVWDNTEIGQFSGPASPFDGIDPDRSVLQEHTIDPTPISGKGGTYYKVLAEEVNWDVKKGWMVNLPWSRQRVLYPSLVLAQEYIFFSTMVPATEAAQCDVSSGIGYNFLLQAVSGTVPTVPVIDTNGDGKVDVEDEIVSGYQTRSDGRDAMLQDGRTYQFCNTGERCQELTLPPEPVQGIKDRVWKQIVNPPKPE